MGTAQKKILIVDDNELALVAAREILTKGGYRVVTVDTPFELDRIIALEKPDLMLIDVGMPMLSGEELVDATKRHRLDACPIVFFSGRPAAELDALAKKHGVAGYIEKQALKDLLSSVARFLKAKA
jgi:CheY-like chemotaxis protein